MLWFVDPTDASRAINLAQITSISCNGRRISFTNGWWDFSSEVNATRIFEQIIRIAQEERYHGRK